MRNWLQALIIVAWLSGSGSALTSPSVSSYFFGEKDLVSTLKDEFRRQLQDMDGSSGRLSIKANQVE